MLIRYPDEASCSGATLFPKEGKGFEKSYAQCAYFTQGRRHRKRS